MDWTNNWLAALQAFGWDADQISEAKLISLSENATYRCEVTGPGGARRRVIVRLHRPGFRTFEEIRSEIAWITELRRQHVVDTPRPLVAPDGSTVVQVPCGELTQCAVVFEFAPGSEPHITDMRAVMEVVGSQTAALHRHVETWQPPQGFTRPVWDVESTIGGSSLWGRWEDTPEVHQIPAAVSVLAQAEQRIRRDLDRYGCSPTSFGLIHGDLRSTNLLVDGDTVRVIDFDDCGTGWFMYDLACSVSFMEDDPALSEWVASWLRGYNRVRDLRSEDIEIIPSLIMARRLLLTAWMESRRETEYAQRVRSSYVAGCVELAQKYLSGALLSDVATV
ncbi:MAG TPA: phosphotransferase [Pseudoclavibacter sp.]|nr:phosphotransferase [Pseudoclavibacter sp.]